MARIFARKERRNTLITIVGPTASGKSALAVKLARRFGGEIISADSRQVYRGLDIGSGKITKKQMMGVPHHLLDVASPARKFSVARYQKLALKSIQSIRKRGKLPILVGGTPFYVYAVVDGYAFPEVKPNQKLRDSLAGLSNQELLVKLKKLDSRRAKTIEQKNRRRLIRALEIVMTTGKPIPKLEKHSPLFDVLMVGIKRSPEKLKRRIQKRLLDRFDHGMITEVKRLQNPPTGGGLSWKRLEELGLEYRYIARYLQAKISYEDMVDLIQKESEDFARRQMLWFKRDPRIHWILSHTEARRLVQNYLKKL